MCDSEYICATRTIVACGTFATRAIVEIINFSTKGKKHFEKSTHKTTYTLIVFFGFCVFNFYTDNTKTKINICISNDKMKYF